MNGIEARKTNGDWPQTKFKVSVDGTNTQIDTFSMRNILHLSLYTKQFHCIGFDRLRHLFLFSLSMRRVFFVYFLIVLHFLFIFFPFSFMAGRNRPETYIWITQSEMKNENEQRMKKFKQFTQLLPSSEELIISIDTKWQRPKQWKEKKVEIESEWRTGEKSLWEKYSQALLFSAHSIDLAKRDISMRPIRKDRRRSERIV